MKYGAKRTECAHHHIHDSKLEAARCDELHILQNSGNITRLEMQPEFRIQIDGKPICVYKADFAYFSSTCRIVEDVKGMLTPVYRLKKKMVEAAHGVVVTEFPVRKKKARKPAKAKA